MTRTELRTKRGQLYEQMKSILTKADAEGRELSAEEVQRWDVLDGEFEALNSEARQLGIETEPRRDGERIAKFAARGEWLDEPLGGKRAPTSDINSHRGSPKQGDTWIDVKSGREIRTLSAGERLADLVPKLDEPLSFGKYFRGIITGDWRGAAAEQRAVSEGVLGSGGYAVPSPLAAEIIDKARNATAVIAAGAVTIPMDSQTLAIARATGDPTAGWHSEAGTITASDLTFDRVTLTAQTLAALAQLSVELAEDAPNIDSIVSSALAKVLAIELDRAALLGSGTAPEPKGIRNQSGVTVDSATFTTNGSVISNAAPTGAAAWVWLAKQIAGIWAVNETPNAAIWAPRTAGELDQLVDSTGQPLRPLPSCEALAKFQTASIPINQTQGTNSDCSSAFIGDFGKLLIGMRTELVLEVSRVANVGSTSLFSTMQVGIRAYLRADVAVSRPTAFRVVTGIRNQNASRRCAFIHRSATGESPGRGLALP